MSHAAVLLAGGKSSRMGRDKSALLVNGEPLWQHQLATLHATEPAELFISGKSDGPYADCGVEILTDEFPDCGPLGGIATALRRCKSDYVLVLAVDMPAMTAEFLRTLLDESQRTAKGIIPSVAADGSGTGVPPVVVRRASRLPIRPPPDSHSDMDKRDARPTLTDETSVPLRSAPLSFRMRQTRLEPLAAIYPRTALPIAEECLRTGEFKLETFIRALEAHGLAIIRPVEAEQAALFTNWNTPDDVPSPETE